MASYLEGLIDYVYECGDVDVLIWNGDLVAVQVRQSYLWESTTREPCQSAESTASTIATEPTNTVILLALGGDVLFRSQPRRTQIDDGGFRPAAAVLHVVAAGGRIDRRCPQRHSKSFVLHPESRLHLLHGFRRNRAASDPVLDRHVLSFLLLFVAHPHSSDRVDVSVVRLPDRAAHLARQSSGSSRTRQQTNALAVRRLPRGPAAIAPRAP